MRTLLLILLAAPLLACGSTVNDNSPSDGGGGTGGSPCPGLDCAPACPAATPTSGTSCDLPDFDACDFGCDGTFECQPVYPEAGAPSEWVKVNNGTCCPEEIPAHGSTCEQNASCSYDHSPWTEECPGTVNAVCSDGTWDALTPASCAPVTTCDPTGSFSIVLSEWSPEAPFTTAPTELVVALDESGKVLSSAPEALIGDDGCSLEARWSYSDCWEEDGQSFCEHHDFNAEINFALETPAGGMTYQCSGECGVMASASLTLQAQ